MKPQMRTVKRSLSVYSVQMVQLATARNAEVKHSRMRSRDGVVERALASHQCGPGSIPGPDAISGLSLCLFSSLLRGFLSGFSGFPPSPKTNIQLIPAGCKLCSKVTHGPYSGCQRRRYKLSVRPCWAASLLYFPTAISRENLINLFILMAKMSRQNIKWSLSIPWRPVSFSIVPLDY